MKRVVAVRTKDDFSLILIFSDRIVKRFDVKPYLNAEVFKELNERSKFEKVSVVFGTVQWESGQDISPDSLYIEGEEISDPGFSDIEIINANADLLNKEAEETLEYQAGTGKGMKCKQ
jgi:hypothetical protein